MERGSNANGEYVRFADGTQICFSNLISNNDGVGNADGAIYTSPANLTWTFPVSFTLLSSIAGLVDRVDRIGGVSARGVSNTAMNYRVWMSQTLTSAANAAHRLIAIGRWF
jgi:hypothetical protein